MPINIFSIISIIGFSVCIILSNFVYFKNPKNIENKIFSFFALSVAYWAFVEFQWRTSSNVPEAYFWANLNSLWPIAVASLFHLVLVLTKQQKNRLYRFIVPVIYLMAVFVAATDYFLIRPHEMYEVAWGWRNVLPPSMKLLSLITEAWGGFMAIIASTIGIVYFFQQPKGNTRNQAAYFTGGIVLITLIGVVTEVIMQEIIPNGFVGLVVPGFMLGNILFGIGISKYELFSLTPEKAALDIISTMSDALFLVEVNGKIKTANSAAGKLLGVSPDNLVNKSFQSFANFCNPWSVKA